VEVVAIQAERVHPPSNRYPFVASKGMWAH
jgi:hypothetical protein